MVSIIHKEHELPGDLHRKLQIPSVYPFEKITLYELLTKTPPEAENCHEI